jgi:3-oxoacyl-[acyl-carrier-protein] synthase-3
VSQSHFTRVFPERHKDKESTMKYGRIVGWGKYAPTRILTNDELAKMVDTSDEWIRARTGIRQRHMATEGETTTTMSVAASRAALERAGLTPLDLDLIILATTSPDHLLPAASSMVQDALGAKCGAFQLQAGCTGFVYGLAAAQAFISTGLHKNILVIGAETISRNVDWQDRETCVLFGDGAGAVIVQACDEPTGVLSFVLGSDGSGAEHLKIRLGVHEVMTPEAIARGEHFIHMNGREVFKFATRVMVQAALEAINQAGMSLSDIDLLIPHQANLRIIELAARHLNLPMDKVVVNIQNYGNTSTASIPIALVETIEAGRVKEGDTLCLVGFGAGLTWAAAVVRWGVSERPFAMSSMFAPVWRVQERAQVTLRVAQAAAAMRVLTARRALGKRTSQAVEVVKSKAGAALLPLYTRWDKRYTRDKHD